MPLPSELRRRFVIDGTKKRYEEREIKPSVTEEDKRKTAVRRQIEDLEEEKYLKDLIGEW